MARNQWEEVLSRLPQEGFLKVSRPSLPWLPCDKKAALIRKGNELFRLGNVEKAKKIFISTGYTDGMIRVGDYFVEIRDFLSAFQMYKMAPAKDKAEDVLIKLVEILRIWLD